MTKHCHHRYEPPRDVRDDAHMQELATAILLLCVTAVGILAAIAVAKAIAQALVVALVAVQ